ncbi:MAG: diguanylate cyclase [Chromatiales bacterium]|nr:diguanylate cyclase [Chromatiales bacterium]
MPIFVRLTVLRRLLPLWLLMVIVPGGTQATESRVELTLEEQSYLAGLGPISVAPDPVWPPFQSLDERGRFTGIAIDLLELVARRLGIDIAYVVARDWDEAVQLSESGQVLVLPFLNQTPARERWLLFTEPLLVEPSVFVTREEHPFIIDAARLSDESIALPRATSVEERIRRDFPNLRVVHVATENAVFQAVSQRQATLTLRPLTVAAHAIRKEGLFDLKIAGQAPEGYVNQLRIGVLKSEPRLRELLDRAIATIDPAEREQIVNRHVNVTIVKPMDYGFVLRVAAVLIVLIGLSVYWNLRLNRINAALRESERSKSVLIANLPGVAYRCRYDPPTWTMDFISEGCRELTGYGSEDLRLNGTIAYGELIHPADRERIDAIWNEARANGWPARLEYRIRTADGREKWVFGQGVLVHPAESGGECMIEGLIIDITARKQAEQELLRIAIHDELTGLYNRRHIMQRLDARFAEHRREGRDFSVGIIDLDHFKTINDTYGHLAGDHILREFAAMLGERFRPYDLVGRHGGEEFIVVTGNSDGSKVANRLERLANEVRERTFVFEGRPITLTFSAGLASVSELSTALSTTAIIALADSRLYQAKQQGRDRVVYR